MQQRDIFPVWRVMWNLRVNIVTKIRIKGSLFISARVTPPNKETNKQMITKKPKV